MPVHTIRSDFLDEARILISGRRSHAVIQGVTDSPGPEDGQAEEFRQQYPVDADEALAAGGPDRVEWREDNMMPRMSEEADMPDEAPRPGAVWTVDEAVVLDPSPAFRDLLRPAIRRERVSDAAPNSWMLSTAIRRERVSDAVLNIWITVRENKHAERVSLRVGTDLIPFETEDALSWSRHEFEEWANEYLNSLCDSHGNVPESEWFDTYGWAREQVDARAASFYAIKEREADAA